jgi:RNA polymerase sigma factor (sigma-70 family)
MNDIDLVRRAQAGDMNALALLLERHRARIRAVGAAMLRPGPEIDDLVHDVYLAAFKNIGQLLKPDAAGAWLAGIARNLCLERLRGLRPEPLDVLGPGERAAREPDPERYLHERARADWLWAALGELSEPLRAVVMLRYFTRAFTYEAMAAVLGIPVGTVRSRLSEARRTLALLLKAHASDAHDDHAALVWDRRAFFEDIFSEYNRGLACAHLAAALRPDAVLHQPGFALVTYGRREIVQGLQTDIDAGVRLRIHEVIAGSDITVIEGAFENPADDPQHCPPFTTQVYFHEGDRIHTLRLYYPVQ